MIDWRSAGFVTDDLDRDGRPELVSLDTRFEVRPPYTSHVVCRSRQTPAALVYTRSSTQDGEPVLVDITRSFPAVIRRNASTAKRRSPSWAAATRTPAVSSRPTSRTSTCSAAAGPGCASSTGWSRAAS